MATRTFKFTGYLTIDNDEVTKASQMKFSKARLAEILEGTIEVDMGTENGTNRFSNGGEDEMESVEDADTDEETDFEGEGEGDNYVSSVSLEWDTLREVKPKSRKKRASRR
jgi:hypothetical protein